jgi:GNAT superfamily N-acetyltransferase
MISDVNLRDATEFDLPAISRIFYAEAAPEHALAALPPVLADYWHILATGRLLVAERAAAPVGFAGIVRRGQVAFVTDLFVLAAQQSGGVGRALLEAALAPYRGYALATLASADPRALALYIRAGMRPAWPNLLLSGPSAALRDLGDQGFELAPAAPEDPALHALDAEICGRLRPEEHRFWAAQEGSIPLWVRRAGEPRGYAVVRMRPFTPDYPGAARVGPLGAHSHDEAAAITLAALAWAAARAPLVLADLPGPHPALPRLLDAGMRIDDTDTFMSSSTEPFCDPARYIGSNGFLF